jgi:hypothetical protein
MRLITPAAGWPPSSAIRSQAMACVIEARAPANRPHVARVTPAIALCPWSSDCAGAILRGDRDDLARGCGRVLVPLRTGAEALLPGGGSMTGVTGMTGFPIPSRIRERVDVVTRHLHWRDFGVIPSYPPLRSSATGYRGVASRLPATALPGDDQGVDGRSDVHKVEGIADRARAGEGGDGPIDVYPPHAIRLAVAHVKIARGIKDDSLGVLEGGAPGRSSVSGGPCSPGPGDRLDRPVRTDDPDPPVVGVGRGTRNSSVFRGLGVTLSRLAAEVPVLPGTVSARSWVC